MIILAHDYLQHAKDDAYKARSSDPTNDSFLLSGRVVTVKDLKTSMTHMLHEMWWVGYSRLAFEYRSQAQYLDMCNSDNFSGLTGINPVLIILPYPLLK